MKKVAALLVLALAAAALAACGSNGGTTTTTAEPTTESSGAAAAGGESGAGGTSAVELEADPGGGLAYTTTEASTEAGQVTIDFENPQALEHDVAIEDSGGEQVGKTDLVASGSASTTVELKPGTYTFYCTVPGHREAGMEGTLTVK
jgi:plastocyanin